MRDYEGMQRLQFLLVFLPLLPILYIFYLFIPNFKVSYLVYISVLTKPN